MIDKYLDTPPETLKERIAQRKSELGDSLCMLGHHYVADEVIDFCDFRGDSLKLSQLAAAQETAQYIVFCGVHFMAESAATLARENQTVCLPNAQAGCGMADMAEPEDVAHALADVAKRLKRPIVPVTYVNTTAAAKAVTAEYGGACCTSSNVLNVFRWALDGAGKNLNDPVIFAIPDKNLAMNTASALGYSPADCVLYDPRLPDGGLDDHALNRAKFILWKGWCYVHRMFQIEHIQDMRRFYPDVRIIVHPECDPELMELADAAGSTSQIIQAVRESSAASCWAIGTESHMVYRLAKAMPEKTILPLAGHPVQCRQMCRVDLPHLAWVLDGIAEGHPQNVITVPENLATLARQSLQRMIDIPPVTELSWKTVNTQ